RTPGGPDGKEPQGLVGVTRGSPVYPAAVLAALSDGPPAAVGEVGWGRPPRTPRPAASRRTVAPMASAPPSPGPPRRPGGMRCAGSSSISTAPAHGSATAGCRLSSRPTGPRPDRPRG